ncbi:MAG TPA: glycosyltransferase family 39 protein [Nitrospiria bacterium]|nr:glycosyltransferase family 39 protein [Nitrospiria bacterium]
MSGGPHNGNRAAATDGRGDLGGLMPGQSDASHALWHSRSLLVVLLLAELLFQAARIDFNSLRYDEAQAIVIGRDVLRGGPCPDCAQHTGSVFLHPVLAALAYDRLGPVLGHWGARAVSIVFGLIMTASVYGIGRLLFGAPVGLLGAVLLTVQAPMLYVTRVGLYDSASAAFLAAAAWCLARAYTSTAWSGVVLFLGGLVLGLAALIKFVTAVYLPIGVVLVLWMFGWRRWSLWFIPGLALGLVALVPVDVLPRLAVLGSMTESTVALGQAGFTRGEIGQMLSRWLLWMAVLALLGWVDKPTRPKVALLCVLALPHPLIHLVTGAEQGLHKNIIQSLLFLGPVAAVGVGNTFRDMLRVPRAVDLRPFGYGLLILLMGVFMMKNLRWLEHQYPNTDPAVAYLQERLGPHSVLLAEESYIYDLYCDSHLSRDRVYGTYYMEYRNMRGEEAMTRFVRDGVPDFIVLSWYATPVQDRELVAAMRGEYKRVFEYDGGVSWGTRMVQIYRRVGPAPRAPSSM